MPFNPTDHPPALQRTDSPPAPRRKPSALEIIDGEHESLAGVLRALRRYVPPLLDHRARPDCEVFATILSYIDTFADRFHHPKEDEFLFRAVRERTREVDGVLLDLQHEHAAGPGELNALRRALSRTRGGGDREVEDFALLLEHYTRSQEDHLRKEDGVVIPVARRVLTPRDWEPIDRAFRANQDPFFGIGANGPMGNLVRHAVAMP